MIKLLLLFSFLLAGSFAYAQEVNTETEIFLRALNTLDSQSVKIITDYFSEKSCRKKTVYNYSIDEIDEFMRSSTYSYFLGLKTLGNHLEYNNALNKLCVNQDTVVFSSGIWEASKDSTSVIAGKPYKTKIGIIIGGKVKEIKKSFESAFIMDVEIGGLIRSVQITSNGRFWEGTSFKRPKIDDRFNCGFFYYNNYLICMVVTPHLSFQVQKDGYLSKDFDKYRERIYKDMDSLLNGN